MLVCAMFACKWINEKSIDIPSISTSIITVVYHTIIFINTDAIYGEYKQQLREHENEIGSENSSNHENVMIEMEEIQQT